MSRDFIGALLQLNAEKGVSREQLVRTVEEAIQSAYRREAPGNEDVQVRLDIETGKMRIFRAKIAVAEVEDPLVEFTLDEAQRFKPDAHLGELVEIEDVDASAFGRIHVQTARQVVLQRLREAEREVVFGQYADRESEIMTGTVSRVEPRGVILDVGKAEAILATTDQSASEHYRIGQHVKAYVLEVRRTTRGPLIYVSRTHKNFLRRLFELEVPEIHAGTVEIKAIAREAGSRSKVAVASRQEGLDPVGATVGQRGGRVQAVVAELGGEKIDVIPWSEDPAVFVANALSPATVVKVDIDEALRIASVTVPERMLSLAIGREGQNARLAAKLTGWRIDIRSDLAPPRDPSAPHPGRTREGAAAHHAVEAGATAGSADAAELAPQAEPVRAAAEPSPAAEPEHAVQPTEPAAETAHVAQAVEPAAEPALAAEPAHAAGPVELAAEPAHAVESSTEPSKPSTRARVPRAKPEKESPAETPVEPGASRAVAEPVTSPKRSRRAAKAADEESPVEQNAPSAAGPNAAPPRSRRAAKAAEAVGGAAGVKSDDRTGRGGSGAAPTVEQPPESAPAKRSRSRAASEVTS